jgi:hypothetical protein
LEFVGSPTLPLKIPGLAESGGIGQIPATATRIRQTKFRPNWPEFDQYARNSRIPVVLSRLRQNHFLKNNFIESIFRRKTFYVETNGILAYTYIVRERERERERKKKQNKNKIIKIKFIRNV